MNFTLDDAYATGGGPMESVQEFATKWVGGYPTTALLVIVLLLIIVILQWWYSEEDEEESFNPTASLKYMDRDDVENMTSKEFVGSYGKNIFNPYEPGACKRAKPDSDDAWAWMYGAAKENMAPKTDNDFSKILAGL